MAPELHRTHQLSCDRFPDAFPALVERVLSDATSAIARLDETAVDVEPDGDECRRAWTAVADRFERVPDEDRYECAAWRCPTTAGRDRTALRDLVAVIDGIAGRQFLFQLELRREGVPVLTAIPHTPSAGIDATHLDEDVRPGDVVGLSGHSACLVPVGTRIEWVAEDRRWSIRGDSLCVETLDGRRTACYGLTNLQRMTVSDTDETVLALAWGADEPPDEPIGRLRSWIADGCRGPPPAIACGTADRARTVRALASDLLAAYDGRSI